MWMLGGLELHNAHIMARNILLWQSSSHFASKTDSCSALSKSTKIDRTLYVDVYVSIFAGYTIHLTAYGKR